MIAIDTNVLLRYLLQDDASQSFKANTLIQGCQRIIITDVVLSETIWTLTGKRYKLQKEDICTVVDQLFKEPNIEFEDGQTVWRALNGFRLAEAVKVGSKKKSADFSDVLILEKSKYDATRKGHTFAGLYSFDVAATMINEIEEPQ